MKRCRIVVAALLTLLIGLTARLEAQNQHPNNARGFTPTGAYSSFDIDHINLFNGNLVITIPLGQQYPVNGALSYRFNLVYNSFIWSRESTCDGGDEPAPYTQFYSPLMSLSRRPLCGFVQVGGTAVRVCDQGTITQDYYQPALINPYVLLQEGKQPNLADRCQSFTTINPANNAGSGWQLHFGKIFRPRNDVRELTTISTEKLNEVYTSPDGSEHQFFHKLHEDDPAESANIFYTRDGSYLRMWRNPSPSNESYGTAEHSYTIEFPNGEKHYFQRLRIQDGITLADGNPLSLPQYEDKLVKIEDRFGNWVKFDYFDDTSDDDALKDNRWEITDSVNRSHTIDYQKTIFEGGGSLTLIDSVNLETHKGETETYELGYDNQRIDVSKPHARQSFLEFPSYIYSDDENAKIDAGFLTSLTLPDGSQYRMPFAESYLPTIQTAGALAPGALVRMHLPTGGRIEWDYKSIDDGSGLGYIFSPGVSGRQEARVSPGVRVRRLFDVNNNEVGKWKYDPKLGEMPAGCTIANMVEPCGAYHIINRVTDPTLDYTEYFFSVYPHTGPSTFADKLRRTASQPHRADYGLPFSKDPRNSDERAMIASDHSGKPLFISSISYKSTGEVVRKSYVRYEGDKYSASDGFNGTIEYNPREVARRTVFKDDGNRYAEVQNADFDGLGHYRKSHTFGNMGNDRRVEVTNFNPGRGTYLINSETNDRDSSITNFYIAFPEAQAWVLGNFDKKIESDFNSRSSEYFNFNDNGLLQSKRIAKNIQQDTTDYWALNVDNINVVRRADDVFVKYGYVSGNLTSENYFGGAKQGGLSTAETFPTPANSGSEYQITYGYQCKRNGANSGTTSVVSTKVYRPKAGEGNFFSVDNDIDCSSGLPLVSRDTAGVPTTYFYGVMGRLSNVQHFQGSYDQIQYDPNLPGSTQLPRVTVKRRANGDSGSNALLAENIYIYDSLGRLIIEKKRKPGNTYQARYTNYNGMGWVTDQSEWLEDGGVANNKKTVYDLFDPFGRAGRITAPDGKVTWLTHSGEREIKRRVSIATQINSSRVVTEQDSITTETYDRHGRLINLSEPSAANGVNTTWSYFYNVNHKLAVASVADPSPGGKGQNRVFGYDNLGNLMTESHPERSWAQYADHDTMGNAGTSFDGTHWLNYTYDGHARLLQVKELDENNQWRPFKEFTYDVAATLGAGKLATATRHNYIMNPYALTNLARSKATTQSSTYVSGNYVGSASLAVDGNTDGNFFNRSVTSTNLDGEAWWQVDLAGVSYIDSIKVWNRTDCCANRLSNFYVLVSDQPFGGASESLAMQRARPGVSSFFFAGQGGPTTEFLIGRTGRYVRVYLTGANYLSLTEVEVIGRPTTLNAVPVREEYNYEGIDGRLGRKVTRLSSASPNPYVFSQTFSYDALGNLLSQTYPECSNGACTSTSNPGGAQNRPWTVHYNYNAGWLTSVGSGTNTTNNNYASSIGYNNNGTIGTIAHGNNVTDTIDQDPNYMGRPARIRAQKAGVANAWWDSGTYQYDGAGNTSKIGNDWYTYDLVGRVVEGSAMSAALKRRYSYDAFGNVLTMNTYTGVVNPGTSNAPTAFNTNVDSATNRLALQYDGAGNTLGLLPTTTNLQAQQFYQYDGANMIKNAPGQTYLYGPDDERVWMVNNNGTSFAAPPAPPPPPPPVQTGDVVWVEDGVPAGALQSSGWNWTTTTNPAPYTGTRAHEPAPGPGVQQQFFQDAPLNLRVNHWDTLIAYVYLDPANPPREVMLQWYENGSWDHRAYWGDNLIALGADGTHSRQYMGKLPAVGQWARLEVPAWRVGLEGKTVSGLAFTLYDGRAVWDRAGRAPASPASTETVWVDDGLPGGAQASENWNWIASNPTPFSGVFAHQSQLAAGAQQVFFQNATTTLSVNAGDVLTALIYIDPANLPQQVMLQWQDANGSFDHRAYWGANLLPVVSPDGTNGRRRMGELPPAGRWIRLEVPAHLVGLEGQTVKGLAFAQFGGRTTWDRSGKLTAPVAPSSDTVWVEDSLPTGATPANHLDSWSWVQTNPRPVSGASSHKSDAVAGLHQHTFSGASAGLTVNTGDTLVTYVYLDPASPPRELMLQWNDGTWEHRAFWGEDLIGWGVTGTTSRRHMGALPPVGRWVRLEIPAHLVGLEGRTVNGMAFTLFDGRVTWDRSGKVSAPAAPAAPPAPPSYTNSIVETVTLRGLGDEVLREYQVNNGKWRWTKDYIYAGKKLLATEDLVGGTRHYHLDHLGTPRVITDSAGNVVQGSIYQYLPFGEEATFAPPSEERLRFTGHERDRDRSGEQLDYMHARFYRAGSARFLSVDPGRNWNPKFPQSWNLYAYVQNDPMDRTDPDGRADVKTMDQEECCPRTLEELREKEMGDWASANQGELGTLETKVIEFLADRLFDRVLRRVIPGGGKSGVKADKGGRKPNARNERRALPQMQTKPPGFGKGWTKLRGDQGYRDPHGNIWKKDKKHGDHWDVSDKKGRRVKEVDANGDQIWPDGPKNKNRTISSVREIRTNCSLEICSESNRRFG